MNKVISFDAYNQFIGEIRKGSPRTIVPIEYNFKLRDYLFVYKNEITNNIILLDKENKVQYLNKMLHELKMYLDTVSSITFDKIQTWLNKFNTTYEEATKYSDVNNELHFYLQSFPVTYSETERNDYSPEKENIQIDFCHYFNKAKLQEAIEFIEDLFKIKGSSVPKLKTNLSVPELATLFRELQKLKPDIFKNNNKAELQRFISNNFTSKKQDNISNKSLKKYFDTTDHNAADFWIENMYTIIDNLKKSKEK